VRGVLLRHDRLHGKEPRESVRRDRYTFMQVTYSKGFEKAESEGILADQTANYYVYLQITTYTDR
jgi:hypothetical protein